MTSTIKAFFIVAFFYCFQNCAPSRYVKPLAKNEQAISFSFGGPMFQFAGLSVPMPFTTFGYGYGLTDKVTAYANLNTTSLLFGDLQTDLGATFKLFEKENVFGISASPALQMAYSIGNAGTVKIWPSADVNAYYHINKKRSYVYAGFNSWFELSAKRAYGEPQARHAIPNVHAGYSIVKTKWQHQFEVGYLGIGVPNLPNVVDYMGIGGKGSISIYYSLIRKF